MFYLRGVQHNFVIEYLDEIETKFKNTLGCLSGFQMGSNHEKNWRLKISWHTPNYEFLEGEFLFVRQFKNQSQRLKTCPVSWNQRWKHNVVVKENPVSLAKPKTMWKFAKLGPNYFTSKYSPFWNLLVWNRNVTETGKIRKKKITKQ